MATWQSSERRHSYIALFSGDVSTLDLRHVHRDTDDLSFRETANQVTPEERDEGWARIYTYRKWLPDNIFTEGSILVLPIDEGRPNYRGIPPRKLNLY